MQGYGSPQQQHPYGSPAPGYQQAPPPGYQQGYQQQQGAYQQGAYGTHSLFLPLGSLAGILVATTHTTVWQWDEF